MPPTAIRSIVHELVIVNRWLSVLMDMESNLSFTARGAALLSLCIDHAGQCASTQTDIEVVKPKRSLHVAAAL